MQVNIARTVTAGACALALALILLPVAVHQGDKIIEGFGKIAAEVLMEDIERNQELSDDDRIYLRDFKLQLEKRTAPPTLGKR